MITGWFKIGQSDKGEKMKKCIGVAGVIALVMAFWTVTASAANWNFYGSARVSTYFTSVDKPTGDTSSNFEQGLQTNSRLGARVKSGNIRGRFEFGHDDDVTIRHLYGEWRFGGGSLTVGQTTTPFNIFTSNQVFGEGAASGDTNLLKWGGTYVGREAMIQLKLGNFKIALVEPGFDDLNYTSTTSEIKTRMPKIEAKYRFYFDKGQLDVAALYNTYELHRLSTDERWNVHSLLLSVGGKLDLGAMTLSGSVWAGQNPGVTGIWNTPLDTPRIVSGELVDCDGLGLTLVGAYEFNDMLRFEAGYGYTAAERDHSNYQKDAEASYYVQARITLAEGVMITPEIGMVDELRSSSGKAQNETLYGGIQWRIDF